MDKILLFFTLYNLFSKIIELPLDRSPTLSSVLVSLVVTQGIPEMNRVKLIQLENCHDPYSIHKRFSSRGDWRWKKIQRQRKYTDIIT